MWHSVGVWPTHLLTCLVLVTLKNKITTDLQRHVIWAQVLFCARLNPIHLCIITITHAGVSQFVKKAFEDSLSGILNKRQVDVLLDIQRCKARGKPYVIVFCGVNGVGKSTNLAKICYWLGQHGLKVQLAACDTFRAGAVEQLKTHAMRLGVSGGYQSP